MAYVDDMHVITKEGEFDARKARQLLLEYTRDVAPLNRAHHLSQHLGLSSEDEALLMAISLLEAHERLQQILLEDIATRIPTFGRTATQSGPFNTKGSGYGGI